MNKMDFKAILARIYLLVGIRANNFLNEQEEAFMFDFALRNFSDYTTKSILNAFEAAICGKLDLKDPNCYENFSCEYFGKILSSYKRFLISSGQLKSNFELERQYIPPSNQLNAPKMTDDEIIDMYKEVWNKTENIVYMSVSAYDALCRKKYIELTKSHKMLLMEEAKPLVEKVFGEMGDKDVFMERVKDFAKKIAVSNYYEYLNMSIENKKIKELKYLWKSHDMINDKIILSTRLPEKYVEQKSKIKELEKELDAIKKRINEISSK